MIRTKKALSRLISVLSAVITVVMLSTTVFASGVVADLTTDNYTIEVTNNGEKVELVNKPFIQNNEVYIPLHETLQTLGVMNNENSFINWNNGKIEMCLNFNLTGVGVTKQSFEIEVGKGEIIHILDDLDDRVVIKTLNAPVLKHSSTYVPVEYLNYILNCSGSVCNIDYTVFNKARENKTIEIIQRLTRALTINEAEKLTPNYMNEQQMCYDTVRLCLAELQKGNVENMKPYCTKYFTVNALATNTFFEHSTEIAPSIHSINLYADGKYRVVFSFYQDNVTSDKSSMQTLEAIMEKQPDNGFLINDITQYRQ